VLSAPGGQQEIVEAVVSVVLVLFLWPQVQEVWRGDDKLAHVDGFREKTSNLFPQRLFVVEVDQLQVDVEVDQRTFGQPVELCGDESDSLEQIRCRQLTEDLDQKLVWQAAEEVVLVGGNI